MLHTQLMKCTPRKNPDSARPGHCCFHLATTAGDAWRSWYTKNGNCIMLPHTVVSPSEGRLDGDEQQHHIASYLVAHSRHAAFSRGSTPSTSAKPVPADDMKHIAAPRRSVTTQAAHIAHTKAYTNNAPRAINAPRPNEHPEPPAWPPVLLTLSLPSGAPAGVTVAAARVASAPGFPGPAAACTARLDVMAARKRHYGGDVESVARGSLPGCVSQMRATGRAVGRGVKGRMRRL